MLFRFYESKLWESSSINGSLSSKLRKSSDWCRTPRLRVMQSDHCPKTAISLITNLPDCIGWRQHFTRDSTEHKPSYCKNLEKSISGIKNSPRPHDAVTGPPTTAKLQTTQHRTLTLVNFVNLMVIKLLTTPSFLQLNFSTHKQ